MPQNIFKKRGKRGAIKKGGRIGRLTNNFLFVNFPFERGEILFSKEFFDFSDIRKLQDKAKTSYTLRTRRPRFDYE